LSKDLFHCPVLFMNGHDDPGLNDEEKLNLRQYIQAGGFLLVSSCCSSREFDAGFRRMVADAFPNDALVSVPPGDPVWKKPYDIGGRPPEGTAALRRVYRGQWPKLLGIRRGGRWVLIYSPVDFCCAFDHELDDTIPAYAQSTSGKLLANIITRAFTP
jgi:hypothetical protein